MSTKREKYLFRTAKPFIRPNRPTSAAPKTLAGTSRMSEKLLANRVGGLDGVFGRNNQIYYNDTRTHLSLNKDAPNKRPIELPRAGAKIISIPHLGGLHHRYARKAA